MAATCCCAVLMITLSWYDDHVDDTATQVERLFESVSQLSDKEFKEDNEYWAVFSRDSGRVFDETLYALSRAEVVDFMDHCCAHLFLSDDTLTRFRWLTANYMFFFPETYCHPTRTPDTVYDVARNAAMQAATKRCISDPEFLRSFAHVVAWRRQFLGNSDMHNAVFEHGRHFERHYKEGEWEIGLGIILVVYFTSREDLMEGKEVSDLEDVFETWWLWFQENGDRLVVASDRCGWVLDIDAERNERFGQSHELENPAWPRYPFENWDYHRDPISPPNRHPFD